MSDDTRGDLLDAAIAGLVIGYLTYLAVKTILLKHGGRIRLPGQHRTPSPRPPISVDEFHTTVWEIQHTPDLIARLKQESMQRRPSDVGGRPRTDQ